MAAVAPLVYVVDDDDALRNAVITLLRSVAIEAKGFSSAAEFLGQPAPQQPTCLILDIRMPHLSGFDIQHELKARDRDMPIIFVTGYGTIPMTVRAMKAGAVEFLTKPFEEDDLLEAVRNALARGEADWRHRVERIALSSRYAKLTAREREVMEQVVQGRLNKEVASRLGTSEITVKVHRRHVMEKMEADSFADLVRMAEKLQVSSASPVC